MKRRSCDESEGAETPEEEEEARSAKKPREEEEAAPEVEGSAPAPAPAAVPELGEDAIYEVLRRADARTLAAAACVSRRWRRLAADERLWESAIVRHWEAARDYGDGRLRPVVLALGGFRRLHTFYLAPLLRPPNSPSPSSAASSSSSSSPAPIAAAEGAGWPMAAPASRAAPAAGGRRMGRDEVQLSLSLLSIGFFEMMSAGEYKGKGKGKGKGNGNGGGGGGGGGGGEGDGRV